MDFDAGLLIFLFIFFVLPLIQRMLGGAKQAPPGSRPGQRRPGVPSGQAEGEDRARLPEDPRAETPDRSELAEPTRAQAERAADLVPDDLWEILTGERRSRTSPQRQPAPASESELETEPYEWGTRAEEAWQPEETAAQVPETYDDDERYEDSESPETPWQRQYEDTARAAPPTPARTAAPTKATESVVRVRPATTDTSPYAIPDATALRRRSRPGSGVAGARRPSLLPLLATRSDLKRAFVLREVLGPPKALE